MCSGIRINQACYNKYMSANMSEQEKRIQELEAQIPLASGDAFATAYQRALQSGQTLVQTIGQAIYEIHPDGSKHFIKTLEPPIHVTPGRYEISAGGTLEPVQQS
jgi:hypothetical protein